MHLMELLPTIDENTNIRLITTVHGLAFSRECQPNELTDTSDTTQLLETEIKSITANGNYLEIYL